MRRLLAGAAIAAAALGTTSAASAAPTCHYPLKSVGGVTVGVCQPGMVCDELCNWYNPNVTCTYTGAVAQVGTACRTVDGL